jgi:hypothetical protein
MKAEIVRASIETIKLTRNPPTVACAKSHHPCGTPLR